jgi:hypothetical protein
MRAVHALEPTLSANGYMETGYGSRDWEKSRAKMLTPIYLEQFVWCAEFLDLRYRLKNVSRGLQSSYGWKHTCERWNAARGKPRGGYVCNGCFIAACVALGFKIAPIPYSPVNVWTGIGKILQKVGTP